MFRPPSLPARDGGSSNRRGFQELISASSKASRKHAATERPSRADALICLDEPSGISMLKSLKIRSATYADAMAFANNTLTCLCSARSHLPECHCEFGRHRDSRASDHAAAVTNWVIRVRLLRSIALPHGDGNAGLDWRPDGADGLILSQSQRRRPCERGGDGQMAAPPPPVPPGLPAAQRGRMPELPRLNLAMPGEPSRADAPATIGRLIVQSRRSRRFRGGWA